MLTNYTIFENTLLTWSLALLILLLMVLAMLMFKRLISKRASTLAEKQRLDLSDLIFEFVKRTNTIFILLSSVYIAFLVLNLPTETREGVGLLALFALLAQLGFWGLGAINFFVKRHVQERVEADAAGATTIDILGLISKIILWTVIFMLILDNIPGVELNTLIASLGIGGIAVALAVQNILGDLFASLSIALDQPFAIDDFIIVGEYVGTVEHIGLKSTRIRSLSGEQLIFSNSDLLNSRVRNFKRMDRRRVLFSIGVPYQTATEKVAEIPTIIQEIIDFQDEATFDRCHFKEYGNSSLNFEVVYFIENADYRSYMNHREAINLAILRRFRQEGIQFAYPTQKLFLDKTALEIV
jgi:small-conductance mechanosensitive channel